MKKHIDKIILAGLITAITIVLVVLATLLIRIIMDAWGWIDWQFVTSYPSRKPELSGIKSALLGSLWVIGFTSLISIPIGIGTAIYLEEFAEDNKFNRFIKLNIANLAGVPSIIYGILGLALFVELMKMGRVILAGSLTMSLLILPIIIITSQEAIKTVPKDLVNASLALGSTKWQSVIKVILPISVPGMVSGIILAISRAIGESAPMIAISALVYLTFIPKSPMDRFTVLPIQIYNWISQPQDDFRSIAAAGIVVLMIVLLSMNSIAIWIRIKFQKRF
ncbi:MAG: phosphate ABC transporter permease PstA [Dehalococcoidia bacterium]|jgi:phosphate transport system permease protein|nr:phosphate ABC transporter permease PstA [Dehalococcoidia bacterium]